MTSKSTLDASRLESLLESAQLLHASLDLEELLRHLLRTVMGRLMCTKALIAVARDGRMELAAARGVRLEQGQELEREQARASGIQHFYPIGAPEEPAGMLGIGKTLRPLEESDEAFLSALLGIAASGIRNASAHARAQRLNRVLEQKVQDLRTLLELVQSLTSTLEPTEIAHLLVLTLTGRWGVSRYALAAWKEEQPPLILKRGLDLPGVEALKEEAQTIRQPARVEELPEGTLKSKLESRQGAVVFPLVASQGVSGIVALGPRLQKLPFTGSDLEFGAGLAAQASVAFENSWHFHETLEKRKIEQEVAVAAGIQRDLFPKELPRLEGVELAARSLAARQVGGDYYDIIGLNGSGPDGPHLICVADVSGKGIPASLLMSSIQATLRALLSPQLPLVELVTRTSQLLYATTPASKYATAVLALLDPSAGQVRYVNAGHNDGLLLRAGGEVERLTSTGPPLGLLPGIPFEEQSVALQPGDLLAVYSDGVVEAQNEQEEEFEEERFLESLRARGDGDADGIIDAVFEAVMSFAGNAPQHDDLTLLVLRVARPSRP